MHTIIESIKRTIPKGSKFTLHLLPTHNRSNAAATYILSGRVRVEKEKFSTTEYGASTKRIAGGWMHSDEWATVTALEDNTVFYCTSLIHRGTITMDYEIKEKTLVEGESFDVPTCFGVAIAAGSVTVDGHTYDDTASMEYPKGKPITFLAHSDATVAYVVTRGTANA